MRKRKKILTCVVLMVLVVSTMLSTFSVFSSAATSDNDEGFDGTWANDVPLYTFYRWNVDDPDYRHTSLWPVPKKVRYNDRIVFGLMGTESVSNPWHIYPYVQGQQNGNDVVQEYNKMVDDLGYTSWNNFYSRSSLITSRAFATYIGYSLVADDKYQFVVEFRVKDISSWSYDWLPLYQFQIEFIEPNGAYNGLPIEEGTFTRMGVISQAVAMYNYDTTNTYTYIDIGMLMRYVYGYSQEEANQYPAYGVKVTTMEYFYNTSLGYPVGSDGYAPNYLTNLYTASGYNQQPFISYGYNYFFENPDQIAFQEYQDGYNRGKDVGYDQGFSAGKQTGVSLGENYNAVDGLITLAQLPAVFISSMLSFDIFGINIANAVKVTITLIIVIIFSIWLLKMLV